MFLNKVFMQTCETGLSGIHEMNNPSGVCCFVNLQDRQAIIRSNYLLDEIYFFSVYGHIWQKKKV